ncbi:O-succinylbenzoic acid--CoA ligase [Reichenbachiella faecimaris]|uniref:O-succinylbenzoic acid--CoA ligase n=1 Tax=Reichenbachiella faecimaris TaxID=692418 RepID=A0A1W2GNL1_REIFA|nr:AMP-binding protein [Reichenbachiella faecimaris]SMD38032.1 O-succinylbenzoic acid--CoA ligase [Reichenbachiella faecimaris]
MKIVFERSEYHLDRLSELLTKYPNAAKIVDFINHWQQNARTFQFQTSGSTGTSKSIDVSRTQIVASVQATTEFLGLKKNQSALLCLDPSFVASLMMVARCLVNDMNLILQRPSSTPLKEFDYPIDFASFVPVQIYKMIEDGTIGHLAKIQNILIGGAPLSSMAFETLAKIDTNIYATYGMTETVSHVALMPVKGEYKNAQYEVLPGITLNQDAEECLGILGTVTNHEWLQTNDIVKLTDSNKFQWLGRRDHVINSGGIKIHPEQLEKFIEGYIFTDFIISWKPNDQLGSECMIIAESCQVEKKVLDQIQSIVTQNFSKYHAPKSALFIDEFIRTDSGKVKREATRRKALDLS